MGRDLTGEQFGELIVIGPSGNKEVAKHIGSVGVIAAIKWQSNIMLLRKIIQRVAGKRNRKMNQSEGPG